MIDQPDKWGEGGYRQRDSVIPRGLCQCGCGKPTGIAARTSSSDGRNRIKGQPLRYLVGHSKRVSAEPLLLFMAKVDVSGGDDACWPWTGTRDRKRGYGKVTQFGVMLHAHRASWAMFRWPVPVGMCVLHRCDNPPCVNPAHLTLGSHGDNMRDMVAKGRSPRGEAGGKAKLKDAEIEWIRRLLRFGVPSDQIADRFGVSRCTISRIGTRRTWAHVKDAASDGPSHIGASVAAALELVKPDEPTPVPPGPSALGDVLRAAK